MQQRRTPSGSGPGARGGRDVRAAGRRSALGSRAAARDPGVRSESGHSGTTRGANPRGTTRSAAGSRAAANRPAARRTAAPGAAKRTRAPQPRRLTGRATIFCMLLIGLLLAYAYPVRIYLSQQAEIDALERRQAAQRAHINDLAGQLEKWNDDEYIKAQARGRLLFVLPGEKPMLVIDPQQAPGGSDAGTTGNQGGKSGPWYGKLWSSIRTADQGAR